ncbi:MAG TPA: hypothetical protein VLF91_00505 [Candidatus Saccharimonadales bacterium]|nr:hypothetical protein [Candidatus Saccharimonadales bacterium]
MERYNAVSPDNIPDSTEAHDAQNFVVHEAELLAEEALGSRQLVSVSDLHVAAQRLQQVITLTHAHKHVSALTPSLLSPRLQADAYTLQPQFMTLELQPNFLVRSNQAKQPIGRIDTIRGGRHIGRLIAAHRIGLALDNLADGLAYVWTSTPTTVQAGHAVIGVSPDILLDHLVIHDSTSTSPASLSLLAPATLLS